MSRSHIACWVLSLPAFLLISSCGTDEADRGTTVEKRPRGSVVTFHKDGVLPADGEFAAYTQTLQNLEAFIERGQRDVRSMGELPRQTAADPGTYATHIDILEDTGSEWSDDLVLIEGGLPEKPARQNRFASVYANLTRAIQELRQVAFTVSGGRTPTTEERRKRIEAAESYLRLARRQLETTAG